MAQKLKDDVRKAIISATRSELLQKGYKGASLRNIAEKADITVGNLYRYYKNKDELCNEIVGPTYLEIKEFLDNFNGLNIKYQTHVFNLKINIDEAYEQIDIFVEKLVDIYSKNKIEFNILLNTKLANTFINKFENIIFSIINERNRCLGIKVDSKLLSNTYSISIYSGLKNILLKSDISDYMLKDLIKIYLKSYISMIEH